MIYILYRPFFPFIHNFFLMRFNEKTPLRVNKCMILHIGVLRRKKEKKTKRLDVQPSKKTFEKKKKKKS